MTEQPTPDHIMQTGTGFMAGRTLLSAVELELFTVLGNRSMMASEGAAFARTEVVTPAGPTSAAIADKA